MPPWKLSSDAAGPGHDRQPTGQIKRTVGHLPPRQSSRTFITPAPACSAVNASPTRSSGSIVEMSDGAGMVPPAMSWTAVSTSVRS
jgi:hypothetical protein